MLRRFFAFSVSVFTLINLLFISGCAHPWRLAKNPNALNTAAVEETSAAEKSGALKAINSDYAFDKSLYSSSKLTMVNVWATTCGPCVEEMPHIQKLADEYASKGLSVLSVLADSETPGKIPEALNYINAMDFRIPVLRYDSVVSKEFPAGSYPYTYFIDQSGEVVKIVQTSNTYDGWVKIVEELLG